MSPLTSTDPAAIAGQLATARTLLGRGQVEQAITLYANVLRTAPDQVESLNVLGMNDLARGQPAQAATFFEKAHAVQPDDASILKNLGLAYRRLHRLAEAEQVFREAVRLDPQFFVARLHLAETLEACKRPQDALPAYFGAVTMAQKQGQWLGVATTAPSLQPLVHHAMDFIDQGRARLFAEVIAPLRERYGTDALKRVDACLAMYLGSLPTAYADPQQKPTFLYFPDLPGTPWFARELFPWYAELEAQTAAIRDEMLGVFADEHSFEPFLGRLDRPEQLDGYLHSEHGAAAWDAFFFFRHGEAKEENRQRCPLTAAALDAAPLCRIRDHAPEVCYSALTPGTHILPHRGVTNARVVTHLPLRVPGDGALRVAGIDRAWQEGCCFTFDDTYLHEAWNRSDGVRIVMLMDTWNPHLTETECAAVRDLIAAIGDFNRAATLADAFV